MKAPLLLPLLLSAGTLALAGCGSTTGAAASGAVPSGYASPTSAVTSALKSIIVTEAAREGDASPTGVEFVATNLGLSAAATGDAQTGMDPGHAVYMMVAHGNFVGNDLHGGPGGISPRGSVLIITVDATTLRRVSLSLSSQEPDLSNVGSAYQF